MYEDTSLHLFTGSATAGAEVVPNFLVVCVHVSVCVCKARQKGQVVKNLLKGRRQERKRETTPLCPFVQRVFLPEKEGKLYIVCMYVCTCVCMCF